MSNTVLLLRLVFQSQGVQVSPVFAEVGRMTPIGMLPGAIVRERNEFAAHPSGLLFERFDAQDGVLERRNFRCTAGCGRACGGGSVGAYDSVSYASVRSRFGRLWHTERGRTARQYCAASIHLPKPAPSLTFTLDARRRMQ